MQKEPERELEPAVNLRTEVYLHRGMQCGQKSILGWFAKQLTLTTGTCELLSATGCLSSAHSCVARGCYVGPCRESNVLGQHCLQLLAS